MSRTARELLVTLGFYGPRAEERELLYADFERISDGEVLINAVQFKAECFARGHRNSKFVRSCFNVIDWDGAKTIDKYKYALFRSATTNFDMERDNSTFLIDLRLKIVFQMYDLNGDGILETDELKSMIRDMASTDAHVESTLAKMGISAQTKCDFATFCTPEIRTKFYEQGLQSRAIFSNNGVQDVAKVVLSHTTVVGGTIDDEPQSVRHSKAAINLGCRVDPEMVASVHWRGLLVDRSTQAFALAARVIENARRMSAATASETDVSDKLWMPENECLGRLMGTDALTVCVQGLEMLADEAERIVKSQAVCVRVPIPAKVFGDTHGQFRDLLLLFREYGFPSAIGGDVEVVSYVFNGDFVDRGSHQIEVVALLFALKISFPSRVFLVRGNHEVRWQNEGMGLSGFMHHCNVRFGDEDGATVFERMHLTFDWLPLAAVVAGKILVLHGGIGDGDWDIEDLEDVARPLQDENTEDNALAKMVLWSDPADGDETMRRGVHPNPGRGYGVLAFSPDVTEAFCARNGLQLVIRSHQLASEGYKIMHRGHLITVFSARNYDEHCANDGAILLITTDEEGNVHCRAKKLSHRLV